MKGRVLLVCAGVLLAGVGPLPRAAADAPAEEKEGTVAGIAIGRANGGWLGVELKDGTFQLTFYNAKKHPVPADKSSAVFWWPVHYQPNPERTELTPTDHAAVLASPYLVKPPYAFKLHISLLGADSSSDVESYVIDFSQ
jgi:hypothetical protein